MSSFQKCSNTGGIFVLPSPQGVWGKLKRHSFGARVGGCSSALLLWESPLLGDPHRNDDGAASSFGRTNLHDT